MQNTLTVAIITSALLAAVLFTGQTAMAQTTSPRVSPQQAGKTISSNKLSQASSNPDVAAELNLGKELVCGSAAVLNGPSGLLLGSVCNSLVAKLNSNSQQQSQTGLIKSPSKGTQPSSPTKSSGSFKPGSTGSTSTSQPKKPASTSQPGSTGSLLQRQQPLCSDGFPPDANGICPPPPSNNNQNQEQQQQPLCSDGFPPDANGICPPPPSNNNQNQTEECPLGPMVPGDCSPPPTTNSNPQPSENIPTSEPGSNSNGGERSNDNVGSNSGNGNSDNSGNNNAGSSNSGEGENGNNPSSP